MNGKDLLKDGTDGKLYIIQAADRYASLPGRAISAASGLVSCWWPKSTTPDWEPVMKIAAAIVTERGARTCHAAIIARELGIPAVVGADCAKKVLKEGAVVTVSCAEGEVGRVYKGALPVKAARLALAELRRPKTAIMLNLGTSCRWAAS